MEHINGILSDKEGLYKPNNDIAPVKDEHDKHTRAESDANFIMDKLKVNGDEYRKFYLKVVYRLSEPVWREILTTANDKGDNPPKLFSFLAKRELTRLEMGIKVDNER